MSYNAQAESYSCTAASPFVGKPGISYPGGWSTFLQVYAEIADATPVDSCFQASALVGQLPSIAHLAPRTQGEIIRVVIRDMVSIGAEADGLVRTKGGWYQWRFAQTEAA